MKASARRPVGGIAGELFEAQPFLKAPDSEGLILECGPTLKPGVRVNGYDSKLAKEDL